MKKYYNKWRIFLNESEKSFLALNPHHYTIDLKIRYDEEARLYEDIFNQVRAIPGVTIISVSEASQTTGIDQKTVRLDLKYMPEKKDVPLEQYGFVLRRKIKSIHGIDGVKFISSKKIDV